MSTNADKFDELIQALCEAGAEGGTFTLLMEEKRGTTHLLLDMSDRCEGICNIDVYVVPSKDEYIYKLCDRLGEEDLDVYDDDVQEAAWEVLERFKTITFTEF
jgi:hypothetical protein